MAEIKRLISTLESDEGYFGMISQKSVEQGISLVEAWLEVESIRSELGLRHRFTSKESFYFGRHRYHRNGGEIFRFQEENSE